MVPCHRNLLAALRDGRSPETTGADNLKTMELVFAAYQSACTNSVVTISRATPRRASTT
jgi:predicted dehydrogenase